MDGVHRLTNRTGSFQRAEPFDPRRRSLVFKTLLNDAQVLGEELTAALQGLQFLPQALLQQLAPRSGFLSLGNPDSPPDSPLPGLRFGPHPNAYALDSGRDDMPLTLVLAGHLVFLGGASTDGSDPFGFGPDNDRYCTVVLPAAPVAGRRDDLVFLELWFAELDDGDACFPWGCVQYLGAPLTNDILNTAYSTTVDNKDVVLRWRLRVIADVDFTAHPWGLSDPAIQAQADGVSAWPFAHLEPVLGDTGLWRAGDGSDEARTELGCTDGYAYAVPLQRVHRRNTTAYELAANPNGAGAALGGICDRPDGLFHDEVAPRDVQDLRLRTTLGGRSWQELTARYSRQVFGNTLRKVILPSTQPGHQDVAGSQLLQVDAISPVSDAGVQTVEAPDGTRRVFSDEALVQATVGFLTNGADDSDLAGALTFTDTGKVVGLSAGLTVEGALIGLTVPSLRWVDDGEPVALAGAWAGLGSVSATAALDTGDAAFKAGGEFCVEFGLSLPGGHGLSHVPLRVHRATLNGSQVYLGQEVADLTLANLSQPGDIGVAVRFRTRAVQEVATREQLTANASGVARAGGKVLDVSAGTARGGLVLGLAAGQTVDVVVARTLQPADRLWLYYDHVPLQSPDLPATLGLEVLHVDDRLHVSNLGTGGGVPGVPYFNPLLQIPDPSASPGEFALANTKPLGNVLLQVNTGLLAFPVLLSTPPDLVSELSAPGTDAEGRRYYSASDTAFVAIATSITTEAQWHRSTLFGVARVSAGDGLLAIGTLVLLCFTHTTSSVDHRAGVQAGSDLAVAVFPLFEV